MIEQDANGVWTRDKRTEWEAELVPSWHWPLSPPACSSFPAIPRSISPFPSLSLSSLFLLRSLWWIPSSSFQASCSKSCVAMNCNCELRFFFFLFYQLISLINVVFLGGLWSYGDQIWEVLWGGMDGLCWGEAMWWTWCLL